MVGILALLVYRMLAQDGCLSTSCGFVRYFYRYICYVCMPGNQIIKKNILSMVSSNLINNIQTFAACVVLLAKDLLLCLTVQGTVYYLQRSLP